MQRATRRAVLELLLISLNSTAAQLRPTGRSPLWIVAGFAAVLVDAFARDLRIHHVAIVAALSLVEGAMLTTIEPVMLPGAGCDTMRSSNLALIMADQRFRRTAMQQHHCNSCGRPKLFYSRC